MELSDLPDAKRAKLEEVDIDGEVEVSEEFVLEGASKIETSANSRPCLFAFRLT
jgi:hypothetical protein